MKFWAFDELGISIRPILILDHYVKLPMFGRKCVMLWVLCPCWYFCLKNVWMIGAFRMFFGNFPLDLRSQTRKQKQRRDLSKEKSGEKEWGETGVGKYPFSGILNITFTYLLEVISPIVGWCLIGTFTNPWFGVYWWWPCYHIWHNYIRILWVAIIWFGLG